MRANPTMSIMELKNLPIVLEKSPKAGHNVLQPLDPGKLKKPPRNGTLMVQVIEEEQEYSFTNPSTTRESSVSSTASDHIARKYQQSKGTKGVPNPAFTGSNSSSLHGGSINSLPVIREQYCCCSRWSRLERNLLIVVSVLGVVILILLIIVTVISTMQHGGQTADGQQSSRWWAL